MSVEESALAIIPRREICKCGFSARNFYIHENIISCDLDHALQKKNVHVFYTVNAAAIDFFHDVMDDVKKVHDDIQLEIEEQIAQVKFIENEIQILNNRTVEFIGDVLTTKQMDTDLPMFTNEYGDKIVKSMHSMVKQVEDGNLELSQPFAKAKEFEDTKRTVNRLIALEGIWTIVLLTLGIAGTIALLFSTYLCKATRQLKGKHTTIRNQMRNQRAPQLNSMFDPEKVASSIIALTALNGAKALDITVDRESDTQITYVLDTEVVDWIKLVVMHVIILIILYVLIKSIKVLILMFQRNNLNYQTFCHALTCKLFKNQTDVYVQIGHQNCQTSLKLYAGTILGHLKDYRVHGLSNMKVLLDKRLLWDKICFKTMKENQETISIEYGSRMFYVPTEFYVRLADKLLVRHLFKQKGCLTLSLILTFDKYVMVTNTNEIDEELLYIMTREDVETQRALKTLTNEVRNLMYPMDYKLVDTNLPEEREEMKKQKKLYPDLKNLETNETLRSVEKVLKVRCEYCKHHTYTGSYEYITMPSGEVYITVTCVHCGTTNLVNTQLEKEDFENASSPKEIEEQVTQNLY